MASGALIERYATTKKPSWRTLISAIDVEGCPFSSMIKKGDVPDGVIDSWQMEKYPDPDHVGVRDNVDATNFNHQPRVPVSTVAQKVWYPFGLSDFMDVTTMIGVGSEYAKQQAHGLVAVKRKIEKRLLSAAECSVDDGVNAYETRGILTWLQNSAQTLYPVPDGWRTPTAQIYTGALASLQEDETSGTTFGSMLRSAFDQRKGPSKLNMFAGTALKAHLDHFSSNPLTYGSTASARRVTMGQNDRAMVTGVDRLETSCGTIDLHQTAFIYCNRTTGAAETLAPKYGVGLDMTQCEMSFLRNIRVYKLPYLGGGEKGVVDAILNLRLYNVLGHIAIKSAS